MGTYAVQLPAEQTVIRVDSALKLTSCSGILGVKRWGRGVLDKSRLSQRRAREENMLASQFANDWMCPTFRPRSRLLTWIMCDER